MNTMLLKKNKLKKNNLKKNNLKKNNLKKNNFNFKIYLNFKVTLN